jgi:hypothetical protein
MRRNDTMKSLRTLLATGAMTAAACVPLGVALTPAASAATMPVTIMGHLTKFTTMSDFALKTKHETLVVDTNAMTHITENGMKEKLHSLKPGWVLTVKGVETAMTVHATSVVVDHAVVGTM